MILACFFRLSNDAGRAIVVDKEVQRRTQGCTDDPRRVANRRYALRGPLGSSQHYSLNQQEIIRVSLGAIDPRVDGE